MEIDQPPRTIGLGNTPPGDDQTSGTVAEDPKRLDKQILEGFEAYKQLNMEPHWKTLLCLICAKNNILITMDEVTKLLKMPDIEAMLKKAWKDEAFEELRELVVERLKADKEASQSRNSIDLRHDLSVSFQGRATQFSWNRPYVGEASTGLLDYIKNHYKHAYSYVNYLAIVQSSGMGKSRTIDEISKSQFMIPMNLQEAESTGGFPPADHDARDYLCAPSTDQFTVHLRVCAFLASLLEETAQVLEQNLPPADSDRPQSVASRFRNYMTAGMTMAGHGEARTRFYKSVVERAKTVYFDRCKQYLVKISAPNPKYSSDIPEFPPIHAFDKLEKIIRTMSTTPLSNDMPLVLIGIDEARTLTKQQHTGPEEWSVFGEMRRALRTLNIRPVFALFLSTNEEISEFTPPKYEDRSTRIIVRYLRAIQPYTAFGFDQFARKIRDIQKSENCTLQYITSDEHIAHYGRPIFGARFDFDSQEINHDIVKFAAMRLLGGVEYTQQPLTNEQKLACLAQRLPIEFRSITSLQRSQEMQQVERHLRVCLKVDDGFESIKTVASSEPLLSEAAYWVMQNKAFDVVDSFKMVLETFAVHKDGRGELLVMLLLTQARDCAVGPPDSFGRPAQSAQRWVYVVPFFQLLFHSPSTAASTPHLHNDTL